MRPWIKYSLIRVLLFAGVFIALSLLGVHWLWAALIAAAVGQCVAYIFFRGVRDEMAASIVARRARGPENADEDEDDALGHRG